MTREEFERQLVEKAQKDAAFRSKLISDPKGTLEAELQSVKAGIALPANLKVTVVEESADHIYLRLPASASTTMSEQELVATAGGAGDQPPPASIVVGLDVVVTVAPGPEVGVVLTPGPGLIVVVA